MAASTPTSRNLTLRRPETITELPGGLAPRRSWIARLLRRKPTASPPFRVTNPGVFPAGTYRAELDPETRTATITPRLEGGSA